MKEKVKVSQGKERQMPHTEDRRGLQGHSLEVGALGSLKLGSMRTVDAWSPQSRMLEAPAF